MAAPGCQPETVDEILMLVIHSSSMLCKRIDPWSSKFVNWAAAKHCALSIKTIFHSYKTWLFHEISNCLLWRYSCLNIVADADQWSWKQTVNHSNLELITKETISTIMHESNRYPHIPPPGIWFFSFLVAKFTIPAPLASELPSNAPVLQP